MSNTPPNENLSGSDVQLQLTGRLLSLDLGAKRVGVAVSDALLISVRPLPLIRRTSWKQLLLSVAELIRTFDAKGLVIGLPLNIDGTDGQAAREARERANNFRQSLHLPVYLQDERLTTLEAEATLRAEGATDQELSLSVDSRSAVTILKDFIDQHCARWSID